ncbi:TonB-dependent receptor [Skermanella mucosa]|uniref:TonB-dependent receptor plug domain-containing protein n=1 Tax=Skermanella mucosa TaxID=1789672 RepID=UPI00192C3C99|nr:TonB-dependent receptor [Skermanella mucosa]UEM23662.1 TonB-dependent receptor [Skermanella mucosa]
MRLRLGFQALLSVFTAALLPMAPGATAAERAGIADLTHLSLEDLMNLRVEVTSASKRTETLGKVAAAVSVLTGDDIRRSGATNIPDALRLIPGVQVARINASKYAISARGFNGRFANKLLVLIDGRSIYTPLFSGVFWELQDTLLEDVDRIEVIRGPGATLWGANAVNGVINIITKPASQTQGLLVTGSAGDEERGSGGIRFGDTFADGDGHYRIYAKHMRRDAGLTGSGKEASDDVNRSRFGFRADWSAGPTDRFTAQGGITTGRAGESSTMFEPTAPLARTVEEQDRLLNADILGRWTRTLSTASEISLRAYVSRESIHLPQVKATNDTLDVEFQHHVKPLERHDMVLGAGYRLHSDDVESTFSLSVEPDRRTEQVINAFVQDEITLIPDMLRFTIGSKFEYNGYSGVELQPSARLLWTPAADHTFWTAVSRAVRTPSRAEDDIRIVQTAQPGPGGLPVTVEATGQRGFDAEDLLAFEAGYRTSPAANLSLDLAAFYNIYDNLLSLEPQPVAFAGSPAPRFALPLLAGNRLSARTWGAEVAAEWQPVESWRLRSAYTLLKMDAESETGSGDTVSAAAANGSSPQHQFNIQSSTDLTEDIEVDVILRHVGDLPALGIDGYTTLDARIGWRAAAGVELSLVGQNLVGGSRLEYRPEFLSTDPTRVERGVYAKATVRF